MEVMNQRTGLVTLARKTILKKVPGSYQPQNSFAVRTLARALLLQHRRDHLIKPVANQRGFLSQA